MRRLLAVLCLLLLLPPTPARADGDPASDVLLAQDVFAPYAPNALSAPVAAALEETVKRAKAKGFAVKVALIAAVRDLGSVGQLFGAPQEYADLLTQEVSFNVTDGAALKKPRILVVQPAGLGGNNLGANAGTALEGLLPDEAEGADGLARTAAMAIGRLATADGKPFALPELPAAAVGAGEGGGLPLGVLVAVPVLLLGLAFLAVNRLTARRATADVAAEPEAAADPPTPADAPA